MTAGEVPAILLVRRGAAIPHVELAQSTDRIDRSEMELAVFGEEASTAEGLVCLPEDGALHTVRLRHEGEGYALEENPLQGKVAFRIVRRGSGDLS